LIPGLYNFYFTDTDTPVELGMEFQGGTSITFDSSKTPDQLKEEFAVYPVVPGQRIW